MKIAVLGANGRSGRAFVELAAKNGHTVRGSVHSSHHIPEIPNAEFVKCDGANLEDVNNLIKDQDAVVSLIGHVKGSPKNVQSDSIANLIKAMQAQKLTRIISLTGTGVRFPGDKVTLMDKILNFSIKLIDPNRINDGLNHVKLLQQSQLEWTIVRVLKLQNTKPGCFRLTEHGPTKLYVSREEVARAILETLEQGSFVRQAPILSKCQKG